MTTAIFVKCPLCGMHRKLDRTGMAAFLRPRKGREQVVPGQYKGRITFGLDEGMEDALIVNVREVHGSPEGHRGGGGFFVSGGLTLQEMKAEDRYRDLVDQIKEACKEILRELDKE